jgi:CRP-like cAMP-binding protein
MKAAGQSLLRPANRLLASLPQTEYSRLLASLKPVTLKKRTVVYHAGDQVISCYFPVSGIISLLSTATEGKALKVGMIGREGMIGISILFQIDAAPYEVITQTETEVLEINASVLKAEFNRNGKLHALLRFVYALLCQISQSAVCHHFHSVEQRLACWLLLMRDRLRSNTFQLTQEFLAYLLGIPRTNVTMTIGTLKQAGLSVARED